MNKPVAISCFELPFTSIKVFGVTEMDCKVRFFTFSVADPVNDSALAVIVATPSVKPLANPASVIVAIFNEDELQTIGEVMVLVAPLLSLPIT